MTAELLFQLCSALAGAGWLLVALLPRKRWTAPLVTGAIVPLLFALVYTVLIATHIGGSKGGFGTLPEVSLLFQDPWLLLAGWVHYLAFDLFIGSWEVRDSIRRGVPHWLVLPCLVLTFLFGPIGLLVYLIIRFMRTRQVAVEERI